LWELDLTNLSDLNLDEVERRHNCGWVNVPTHGNASHKPGDIAYHTSVVYKDNMYLFGGNNYKAT